MSQSPKLSIHPTPTNDQAVEAKPSEVLIGKETITDPSQVYKSIVALLIAEGHLASDTKVEEVFALPPEEFSTVIQQVRALIAVKKIVPDANGGPCNRTPDQAITYAEKLKPLMPHLGEARCLLLGKRTLQHLQILEGEALAIACLQIAPFLTNPETKTDETIRQISMIPPARYAALGTETIGKIKPDALHQATILEEEKLKAIGTEIIAKMDEETIRCINNHLSVERIQAIGSQNLVGLYGQVVQIIGTLSDEVFNLFPPSSLQTLLIPHLEIIAALTPEQINLVTPEAVLDFRIAHQGLATCTPEQLKKLGDKYHQKS